jgi:hypothetical protein
MENVALNKQAKLSPHFTLGKLCKTSVNSLDGNIPGHEEIENLKRLCPWLEELRKRYNERYNSLPLQGEMEEVTNQQNERPPLAPPVGGENEEPIIISSGYRSPEVNKCVGGVHSSNHLTGCAVDIRCVGVEQAIRYAAILLDAADDWKQDFDELLIERNRKGRYWVHFAVRPPSVGNRRKVMFIEG